MQGELPGRNQDSWVRQLVWPPHCVRASMQVKECPALIVTGWSLAETPS